MPRDFSTLAGSKLSTFFLSSAVLMNAGAISSCCLLVIKNVCRWDDDDDDDDDDGDGWLGCCTRRLWIRTRVPSCKVIVVDLRTAFLLVFVARTSTPVRVEACAARSVVVTTTTCGGAGICCCCCCMRIGPKIMCRRVAFRRPRPMATTCSPSHDAYL